VKRVLVVDDHPLFRDGVASLLRTRGYEVVGEAADGVEAVEQARRWSPDIVLMDIHMPRLDGLAATRVISTEMPAVSVVILTISDDDADLFEAIKSGARGYLLKNTDTETFFSLLGGLATGEAPISGRLAGKILGEFARLGADAPEPAGSPQALSEREKEVLHLASEGLTNRDIGSRLNLSENTIKYHFKNILQKLHLRNRAQAAAFAQQSGLVTNKRK
jgi:DNA-binding NarL/FixJ family response regulator